LYRQTFGTYKHNNRIFAASRCATADAKSDWLGVIIATVTIPQKVNTAATRIDAKRIQRAS
jgi:hypothetical protein